jgi:uncharacterized protein YecA (UPF0149 family)
MISSVFKRILGLPAASAPAVLPGRNEPCWCGSGEKYKRCHLESDLGKARAKQRSCCTSS